MDAGSDNGFTFTSPNWPTIPQQPVSRITAQSPDHPANSFFYPDRLQHPPIATFQFVKVREYELAREFDASPSPVRQVYHQTSGDRTTYAVEQGGGAVAAAARRPHPRYEDDFVVSNDVLPAAVSAASVGPGSSKHALINNIMNKISKRRYKKNRRGRKMATRKAAAAGLRGERVDRVVAVL
ncbi:hypothetical protein HAZT_HAZT003988 [Hyalella azteca]|uniref:Spondin domain-containing protein n=1 Tax=Hyalella azteca TaxID=294128 RepID=A0A6A0H4E9_HYAAZ|nr:hypothetical protein HAZT_HAZT003988 [Hyalella azteca]